MGSEVFLHGDMGRIFLKNLLLTMGWPGINNVGRVMRNLSKNFVIRQQKKNSGKQAEACWIGE